MRSRPVAAVSLLMLPLLAACAGTSASGADVDAVLHRLSTSVGATPLASDAAEVKIGLYNLEGGGDVSLPSVADAQQAVISYANDYLGGLAGRRIVAVRCGAGDSDRTATACARRFVDEGVVAVVSGRSARSEAVLPTLEDAGIAYFGAALNDTAEIAAGNGYFLGPGFIGTISAWAEMIHRNGHTTVGVVMPTGDGATSVEPLLRSLFAGNGLEFEIVTLDSAEGAASTVSDLLATEPQTIAVVADTSTCTAVLAELGAARYSGEVLGIAPCLGAVDSTDKESAAGLPAVTVLVPFVASGTGDDAELYTAVLHKYGRVAESEFSAAGFASMLGFLRLLGGLGVGDQLDAAVVSAELGGAGPVAAPLGGAGAEIRCAHGAFGAPLVRSRVCSAILYAATSRGGAVSVDETGIDSNVGWSRAFG